MNYAVHRTLGQQQCNEWPQKRRLPSSMTEDAFDLCMMTL